METERLNRFSFCCLSWRSTEAAQACNEPESPVYSWDSSRFQPLLASPQPSRPIPMQFSAVQLRSSSAVGFVVDVIPGDDVGAAGGHGGADGKGEALVKGLAEQRQHLVAFWAVRQVSDAGGAGVADSRIGVLHLQEGTG